MTIAAFSPAHPAPHPAAAVGAPAVALVPLSPVPRRGALAAALQAMAPPGTSSGVRSTTTTTTTTTNAAAAAPTPLDLGSLRDLGFVAAALRGVDNQARQFTHGLAAENRALAAALELHVPSDLPHSAVIPELDVLRDPLAYVQPTRAWDPLLQVHGNPTWLRSLLQKETPQEHAPLRFAQENRLRALARYLIGLRAMAVSGRTAEQLAELLPACLALPSVESRHRLLNLVLGYCKQANQPKDMLAAWRAARSPEAKALALAACLVDPMLTLPAPRAVLESRGVVTHGVVARRVLAFILDPKYCADSKASRDLLAWATDGNLLRLLRLGCSKSPTLKLTLGTLQANGTYAAAADKLSWQEARTADQQRNQVLNALWADRHARLQQSTLDLATWVVEVERLQAAFAWVAAQPDVADTGRTAQALCRRLLELKPELKPESGAPVAAPDLRRAAIKDINRLRTAARSQKKTPRSEWLTELLTQLEHCVDAGATLAAVQLQPAVPSPTPVHARASFFANKAVHTYVNQRVVPLVLALVQHAPILRAHRGKLDVNGISQPLDVVKLCVPWFKGEDAETQFALLQAKVRKPENLVGYAARSQTWTAEDRRRGLPVLERVVRAVLDGTYNHLRRQAPQMQALCAMGNEPAMLANWEAGHSEMVEPPAGEGNAAWRVYDTADVGDSLDAMEQITSCQSPTDGWASHNLGNLGRFIDGSKRLIVLRDARDKVRARGIVRLMLDFEDRPVLALSTLFSSNALEAPKNLVRAYAARRAGQLGIAGVYSGVQEGPATRHQYGASYQGVLRSLAAEVPDYYDEIDGLCAGRVATVRRSAHLRPGV